MYGTDDLSKSLLIPSGPADFQFSSLDMHLPSSGMKICWMITMALAFVLFANKIHVEYLSIQMKNTQRYIILWPKILPQKGSDY